MDPALRRALPALVVLAVLLRVGLFLGNVEEHPGLLVGEPVVAGEEATTLDAEADAAGRLPSPSLSPVGFEAANVARALVCSGRGYADPFGEATGPTGWVSPGVVALYAVPFALFGCFTPAAVLLVYGWALLLAAGQTVLAAGAAERLFGDPRAGLVAGVLMAFSPFDLRLFAAASSLDLNLQPFLLLLLLYLLLGLQRDTAPRRLAAVAVAGAVATLCNPVFAAVTLAGTVVALRREGARRLALGLLAVVAAQAVVVGPYLLHQRFALGTWTFVKSNGPFELYLGNHPQVGGVLERDDFRRLHPSQNAAELAELRRLGEARYVERHGRRFLDELEPRRFLRWTAVRTGAYFFGTGTTWIDARPAARGTDWRGRLMAFSRLLVGTAFVAFLLLRRFRLRPGEGLVFVLAAVHAAPHLLAAVMPRYVLPVTPLALLLGAGLALAAYSALATGRSPETR